MRRILLPAAALALIGGMAYLLVSLRGNHEPAATDSVDRSKSSRTSRTRIVRPGPNAPTYEPDSDQVAERGRPELAASEPEEIGPVGVARQRLTRIRMKYRWDPAELVLGRKIGADERTALEDRFEEIAADADNTVGAFDSGGRNESSAIEDLRRLELRYRTAAMDALGMTEEQWAQLPELPGGPLPPQLR